MTFEQIDKIGGLASAFLFAAWVVKQFISGKAVAGDILERAETREQETNERFDRALELSEQGIKAATVEIERLKGRNQLLESELRRVRKT